MGRPFVAFEDSADLALLSFAADRYGAAVVTAARRNIAANPLMVFFWWQRTSNLQDAFLFMFPAPYAGIRTTSAEVSAGLGRHTYMLTLGGEKSCRVKWLVALKVRRCAVLNRRRLGLLLQLSPTCGASGKGCRSRAERNASRLQTSWASSCRNTKKSPSCVRTRK